MNSKITKPGTRVGLKHYVIISYAHEVGYHIIKVVSFTYLYCIVESIQSQTCILLDQISYNLGLLELLVGHPNTKKRVQINHVVNVEANQTQYRNIQSKKR